MNLNNVSQTHKKMKTFMVILFLMCSCNNLQVTESSSMTKIASDCESPNNITAPSSDQDNTALNVMHFGADPSGQSLSNLGVELAFQAASEKIGATVVFPPGIYLLQPLQLSYSNINIHFEDGAIWQAVQDEDYIRRPTTYSNKDPFLYYRNEQDYDTSTDVNEIMYYWPITPAMATFGGGREDGRHMRYEAFFSVTGVENVTISGQGGNINGGGPVWWYLFLDHALHYTRPSLVEIRHSNNIVVSGIRLEESPFWTLHFYNNSNVLVHDLHIHNEMSGEYQGVDYSSRNADGIDVDSCRHVVIKDSVIHTHDDAIVIKSGLDLAGLNAALPSYDILLHNITTKSPAGGGLTIGSEVSGGISNVTFSNCTVYGSLFGIRVKTAHGRGSSISNITFRDINIITNSDTHYGQTSAIQVSMFGGNRPSMLKGYRWSDITTIENISFDTITILPSGYNVLQSNSDAPMDKTKGSWSTGEEIDAISTIHILGDTNLLRYWFSPFHSSSSNEYIRNISFRNVINHATNNYTIVSGERTIVLDKFSSESYSTNR